MRQRAKVDRNHGAIRDSLRELGFKVEDTSKVGRDFPDLIIFGLDHILEMHRVLLVEVKYGKGKLSAGQQEFAENWRGAVITAYSLVDVLAAFGWTEAEIGQVVRT